MPQLIKLAILFLVGYSVAAPIATGDIVHTDGAHPDVAHINRLRLAKRDSGVPSAYTEPDGTHLTPRQSGGEAEPDATAIEYATF
jgi:hypothetical protein